MIKLTRVRTSKAVPKGLRGAALEKKCLDLLKLKREKGELASKEFKSSYWKPAKEQLRKESNNKCAYCEADTKVVAHGDVEHFRPKTIYWWLAYCYDNYLYSCQICNQTYKSNKFPISGRQIKAPVVRGNTSDAQLKKLAKKLVHDPIDDRGEATLDAFIAAAKKEQADLVDPYLFDPEQVLVWEADDVLRQVKAVVARGVPKHAAKQLAIDNVFGLNREELLSVRYQDYSIARTLGQSLTRLAEAFGNDDPLVREVESKLSDMTAANHRFAGMLRYFVRKIWKLDLS